LLWEIKYEKNGFSVQAAIAKNRPLPQWYLDKPELDQFEEWLLVSFFELSNGRVDGKLISWRDIADYSTLHEFDPVFSQVFKEIIIELDVLFWQHNKSERSTKEKEELKKKARDRNANV